MPRERAATGEYRSTVSDDAVVRFVGNATDPPFRTTAAVADYFDIDRSAIYRRLQQLVADERLAKHKVGARAVVWYDAAPSDGGEDR